MSDDEGHAAPHGDGEMVLYDFFKHLTSLVLITIGGLLLVVQDFAGDIKPRAIVIVFVMISASGVLSFSGASDIVRAKYLGKPTSRSLQFVRIAAPILLALGLGFFLAMFIGILNDRPSTHSQQSPPATQRPAK